MPPPAPERVAPDWPDPRNLGRSPTLVTSLAEQVAPYYRDVPGGFEKVIRDSQKAMKERGRPQSIDLEEEMEAFPKYRESDLRRPIGVFRGAREDLWGEAFIKDEVAETTIDDEFMPTDIPSTGYPTHLGGDRLQPGFVWRDGKMISDPKGDYNLPTGKGGMPRFLDLTEPGYSYPPEAVQRPSWPFSREHGGGTPREQVTLEHELGHHAFWPRPGQPGYRRGYGMRVPGLFNWTIRPSERTRYTTGLPRPLVGDYNPRSDEYGWDYLTTPSELDTRLGQIKRAYSLSHPGKHIQTMGDAREAWDWWRTMMESYPDNEGRPWSGLGGQWYKKIMDAINRNPIQRNIILQRLRELVQNQPGGLEQALIG